MKRYKQKWDIQMCKATPSSVMKRAHYSHYSLTNFCSPQAKSHFFGKWAKESSNKAFRDVSSVTQEKTKIFLENGMVAGHEALLTYERPRRNYNREEVVRHRRTTVFVCCLLTWWHEKLFLNLVKLICKTCCNWVQLLMWLVSSHSAGCCFLAVSP